MSEIPSRLHPGEPFFVIRAQDIYAAAAIRAYAALSKHAKSTDEIIRQITEWQKANPDKVKKPD